MSAHIVDYQSNIIDHYSTPRSIALRQKSISFSKAFRERKIGTVLRGGRVKGLALVLLASFVAIVFSVVFLLSRRGAEPNDVAQTIEGSRSEDLQDVSKLQAKLPEGWGVTGGIARPSTDVKTSKSLSTSGQEVAKVKSLKKPEGGLPVVSADTNEQTKQLAIALKENTRPELQSSFVTLRDFDAEKFKTLGKDYSKLVASEAQPGRVFAPAQPGEGVSSLRPSGSKMHRVTQGESVSLKVKATPFAPVSFTSFGGGQFDNSLSSITVVANESGLAQSTFAASSGTKNTVQVMAASPVNSEQFVFSINVKLASN